MINKEIITKKAIQLFRKNGYDAVTIQDICEACDITKPTFYNYVKAKENLILDVYDGTIQELMNDTYKLLSIESSYEQFVYAFSKLIKDTEDFHYDLVSQLFIANFKENKESFALREPLTKLATTILKQAQYKEEILNQENPEVLYKAVAHLFTGYTTMWCMSQGKRNFMEEFFEALNVVLMVKKEYREVYKKYQ